MFLLLALFSSLTFAHNNDTTVRMPSQTRIEESGTSEVTKEFSIHRVEARNSAIIASKQANTVKVGEEFTVETPYGACHVPVTRVIEDYFYVDTQQCQSEFISQGTTLRSTRKVRVEVSETTDLANVQGGQTISENEPAYMQTEFYQGYVKNRASAYISYYTGNTLDGSIAFNNTTRVEDLKGSNAIGIGADYKIVQLPYSLSVMGGFAYALPRSYGSYELSTPTATGRQDFDQNPELETASLYFDMRYQFSDKVYGLFGVNRLFTRLSKFRGDMTGDFGFHLGARYYPTERLKGLFVHGDINFYNMDYEFQNVKADFSLTELEIKAGYTF